MISKLSTTVLCLLPFVTQVFAWKSEGHLLVSRVAYEKLQKENPQALARATNLLKYGTTFNPDLSTTEQDYPFVESSTFADLIKYHGGGWQGDWHFIDTPYLDQGGSINSYPKFVFNEKNITTAIEGIVQWITQEDGYKESFVYQTMMPKMKDDEQYGQSYALRLLIHFLGDIHQPLHCLSRVDQTYPVGDKGGNAFNLPNHYEANNLHSVWDSVIYEFHKNDKLPYTQTTWQSLGEHVDKLVNSQSIDASEYQYYDVYRWADETFKTGSQNAYTGVKEGEKVPDDYISKNNQIAERQVVLGGYRLAYLIEKIFSNGEKLNFVVNETSVEEVKFLQ